MAVAFDNSADLGNNGGGTSSLSAAYTCSGSNLSLLVGVVGDVLGGADDITGVSYNGASLSFIDKIIAGVTSPNRYVYLYGTSGPTTGTHNVVVSASSAHYLLVGAASYTGTAQSGFPDNHMAFISNSATTSFASVITTVTDQSWVTTFEGGYDTNSPPSAGLGATLRSVDGAFGTWGWFDSNALVTPAENYSLTTDRAAAINPIIHLMVSLAPASSSTPITEALFDLANNDNW